MTNPDGTTEIRTTQGGQLLPTSSLYHLNTAADSHVLVETDPNFTNQKKWLSSDYMYNALRHDHENVHKRLGDGYYEQRLVREQINQLTGRQFVGEYTDFEEQYKGLMNAGISFANSFNLTLGTKLSAAQVALLTTDIVWLEQETITLSDGSTQTVLVPKVYTVVKEGDLKGDGTLISASNLSVKTNELVNQGTIAGRNIALFNSNKLINNSNLSAGMLSATVNGDLANIGGNITAEQTLLMNVTGNLTHQSTTRTDEVNLDGYHYSDTHIDRKASMYVKGENGTLQVAAGNITVSGADIVNDGNGVAYLNAKTALNLTALSTAHSENVGGGDHYRHSSQTGIAISKVQGKSDVILSGATIATEHSGSELSAGNVKLTTTQGDLDIIGSTVQATKVALDSANNINLESVQDSLRNRTDSKNSGWSVGVFVGMTGNSFGLGLEGSAQVGKGRENTDSTIQYNSYINGEQVSISSKKDTALRGAQINADKLAANINGNLTVESRQDSNHYDSKQTQTGVSAAVAIYGTGTSASASFSQNKAKINYAQVEEQSGFNVGNGGMNVNVDGNTHLKGGLIQSSATEEKNHFSTGTLTTENIENHSEIEVEIWQRWR